MLSTIARYAGRAKEFSSSVEAPQLGRALFRTPNFQACKICAILRCAHQGPKRGRTRAAANGSEREWKCDQKTWMASVDVAHRRRGLSLRTMWSCVYAPVWHSEKKRHAVSVVLSLNSRQQCSRCWTVGPVWLISATASEQMLRVDRQFAICMREPCALANERKRIWTSVNEWLNENQSSRLKRGKFKIACSCLRSTNRTNSYPGQRAGPTMRLTNSVTGTHPRIERCWLVQQVSATAIKLN